jgi:endonuclease YncB( thermonuclease family)
VIIEAEKNGNFFGTILVPGVGNISVELLRGGFARVVDVTAAYCSKESRDAMKNAEREAKHARRSMWKNFVPPVVTTSLQYEGVCIEVISGDQIVVLVKEPRVEERRISLSSTKAPRMGNPRYNANYLSLPAACIACAKEWPAR